MKLTLQTSTLIPIANFPTGKFSSTRILNGGEIIEKGDEYAYPAVGNWKRSYGDGESAPFIGDPYYAEYRRPEPVSLDSGFCTLRGLFTYSPDVDMNQQMLAFSIPIPEPEPERAHPRVDCGEGYHLLEVGTPLEEGDEMYNNGMGKWFPTVLFNHRCVGEAGTALYYRRKIEQPTYRALVGGDMIKDGDEFFDVRTGKWTPVSWINYVLPDNMRGMHRRPIN